MHMDNFEGRESSRHRILYNGITTIATNKLLQSKRFSDSLYEPIREIFSGRRLAPHHADHAIGGYGGERIGMGVHATFHPARFAQAQNAVEDGRKHQSRYNETGSAPHV